jgi:manganese/zinc/iron transport system substrate-binding protein
MIALLSGCGGNSLDERQAWMEPNGKIKVLCTIAMINDIVREVGGPYVDSLTLIKGELDPHSYQLVKGDDEKFAQADQIFFNGLGLEHGPSLQNILLGNQKAVGLGNLMLKATPERFLHYQGQLDPHIWMDVSLWADTLPFIVEALAAKDPVHASIYKANADRLYKEMEAEHRAITALMQAIPEEKRYLVTSHDAFQYFVRAYLATDKEREEGSWLPRCAAPEGLAPESQLSVAEIQAVIEHVARYRIQVLFPESNVSKDSIRKIVQAGKEKGLQLTMASDVLYADAMGPPGSVADTYLKMVRYNAETIARYLKYERK